MKDSKNKKSGVYKVLDLEYIKHPIIPSNWCKRKSEPSVPSAWSKCLDVESNRLNKEEIGQSLYEIFKPRIDKAKWISLFHMAVSGSGKEIQKITTLHSSSLLALLVFSGVSTDNPLEIDGIIYSDVLLEVKNKVFPNSSNDNHPSNVDILLISEDKKTLLFLESKFTEYVDHNKVEISEKYAEFYNTLIEKTTDLGIKYNNGCLTLEKGRNNKYLGGIKQMISHIIGLATGPAIGSDANPQKYNDLFKQADHIKISTVAYDWNHEEFKQYQELHSKVLTALTEPNILKECLRHSGCNSENIERITIRPDIIPYHTILVDEKNANFKKNLSDTIKGFYKF